MVKAIECGDSPGPHGHCVSNQSKQGGLESTTTMGAQWEEEAALGSQATIVALAKNGDPGFLSILGTRSARGSSCRDYSEPQGCHTGGTCYHVEREDQKGFSKPKLLFVSWIISG